MRASRLNVPNPYNAAPPDPGLYHAGWILDPYPYNIKPGAGKDYTKDELAPGLRESTLLAHSL